MNEIDLLDFLKKYENTEILFVPNPGNSGDFLITYVTIKLFEKFCIKYTFGDCKKRYRNKTIYFGGGGNINRNYKDFKNFFISNKLNNKIIILPHTLSDNEDIISEFNENNIILCREMTSYNHVRSLNKNHQNIFLCHDVAFYIDKKTLNSFVSTDNNSLEKILYCFRTDRESKQNIRKIPSINRDLSLTTYECNDKNNKLIFENVVKRFVGEISKYEEIYTDRLHVAIIACLLNKKVNFYANSYYKNESVYLYSMKNRENISFFDVF
jgi:exopolysaccharide biosynthesis predicted pyruvyltransferase EpsI